jgi:hypothetical protein
MEYQEFQHWFNSYPVKPGKSEAQNIWIILKVNSAEAMETLAYQMQSDYFKRGGLFPRPVHYLKQCLWKTDNASAFDFKADTVKGPSREPLMVSIFKRKELFPYPNKAEFLNSLTDAEYEDYRGRPGEYDDYLGE